MMLAAPWPMSSWFESWRAPVMPSATTAVSSDSMAPNKAMAKAGPDQLQTGPRSEIAGHEKPGSARGMPPNALPMVATPAKLPDQPARPSPPAWPAAGSARASGPARARTGGCPTMRMASVSAAISVVARCRWGSSRNTAMNFSWKCRPDAAGCSPKKSFHCPTQMMTAMPAVKPTITGLGNELDHAAEPRESHDQQDETGHERGGLQAGDAVLRGDAGEHGDEGAGGPRDLHARAAKHRGHEAGDDGGVQPLRRASRPRRWQRPSPAAWPRCPRPRPRRGWASGGRA